MSNGREPTLADVILGLERIQTDVTTMRGELDNVRGEVAGVRGDFDKLRGEVAGVRGEFDKLRGEVAGDLDKLRGELTSVRVALMDRMDRLQNVMTAMREEQIILNGLVVANQKTAERGLGEARFAVDQTSTLAQTIGSLQMQIRQLRADVDEIRDRPHA